MGGESTSMLIRANVIMQLLSVAVDWGAYSSGLVAL